MIYSDAKINPDIFEDDVEVAPTRNGFGDGVAEEGERNKNIVVLTADLSESVRAHTFAEKFPERFFECGIAEQSMVSVAVGLAHMGKIPFATSYAAFSPGRNWEQIRTTVCYNNEPVKIIGSHAGLLTGPDGGTHQALEDLALTRTLPNMVVINPCDYEEAKKATIACSRATEPTYIRLCRAKTPKITTKGTPFEIGKAVKVFDSHNSGTDVAILSTGILLSKVLKLAHELEGKGIGVEVYNFHTVKPLDEKSIIDMAKRSGAIVTVEEHQKKGGFGSAVAEVLSENIPTPQEYVAVNDRYGQSGDGEDLLDEYGLSEKGIIEAVERVLCRKNNN
jgi:transketolase